jgi:hypothetical protein
VGNVEETCVFLGGMEESDCGARVKSAVCSADMRVEEWMPGTALSSGEGNQGRTMLLSFHPEFYTLNMFPASVLVVLLIEVPPNNSS